MLGLEVAAGAGRLGGLGLAPPAAAAAILRGQGVGAVVDWWRLRPALSLPAYAAAQALDDLAYQWGLLRGCVRERSLRPLAVELRLMTRAS